MISVRFDNDKQFAREMQNLVSYSNGFLQGAEMGMPFFLATVGEKTKEILEMFVDSNARTNPESLHHVYEWYQTGSPNARLFDIDYRITSIGLTFNYTFSQSRSIKNGSNVPFYDKAKIMEESIGVTIAPKKSSVLVFEDGGKTVFTRNPIRVENPGGAATKDSFDNVFEMFFAAYFRQSFLETSGLKSQLGSVSSFSRNLTMGLKVGRGAGISAGTSWIRTIGVGA
jgi:hypothetical protein